MGCRTNDSTLTVAWAAAIGGTEGLLLRAMAGQFKYLSRAVVQAFSSLGQSGSLVSLTRHSGTARATEVVLASLQAITRCFHQYLNPGPGLI